MPDKIENIILFELREFRKDTDARLRSLEETRAETRGVRSIAKIFLSTGFISAIVSWFTNTFHH